MCLKNLCKLNYEVEFQFRERVSWSVIKLKMGLYFLENNNNKNNKIIIIHVFNL